MAMSLRVAVPGLTLAKNTTAYPKLRFGLLSFRASPVTAAATAAESRKREPRGIMRVSEEMQDFLGGVTEIPRGHDPENKKVIICDEKLKTIFAGKDRVGFLEIAGLISPHFLK